MKIYVLIGLTCAALSASGQVTVSFATGVGKYAMGGLKELQQDFIDRYQVNGQVNAAFPAYVYYEGGIGYNYNPKFFSEIFFAYGSTGGRVSYADYSGQVAMTQKVNYKAVTSSFGIRWWRRENLQFDCVVRVGTIVSFLTLDQVEQAGTSSWSHHGKYEAVGYVVEPNFKVTRISGHWGIFAFVGLNTTVHQSFFESVDFVDYITTPHGTYMKDADWSGLRVGTGVTFIFGRKRQLDNHDDADGIR